LSNNVFADSPSFQEQEIRDTISDWIDSSTNQLSTKIYDEYTDIVSVTYFSDGKTLNATLWLLLPFKENPDRKEVHYGMLIDTDFDSKTGYEGIDYQVELQWKNQSQLWNKVTKRWSANGQEQIIETISNITNFYEKQGYYTTLSVDLKKLKYPQEYKVLFYSSFRNDDDVFISDFSRWITIPPLNVLMSLSNNTLTIRPGEQQNVEIKMKSSLHNKPIVNLYTDNNQFINADFSPPSILIPSYGIGTSILSLSPSKYSSLGTYTLFLFANSTFPSNNSSVSTMSSIPYENRISTSSITITVLPPLSIVEKFGNIISIIALISFLLIPTILSLRPSILTKRLPDLISIANIDILHVNAAIIAGVLIFLSLQGSNENVQTRITLITANIVFPFAISTIAALTNHPKFSIRLMVSGFINLMISIILIAFIKT
jgi:hypothetical protein